MFKENSVPDVSVDIGDEDLVFAIVGVAGSTARLAGAWFVAVAAGAESSGKRAVGKYQRRDAYEEDFKGFHCFFWCRGLPFIERVKAICRIRARFVFLNDVYSRFLEDLHFFKVGSLRGCKIFQKLLDGFTLIVSRFRYVGLGYLGSERVEL